MDAPVARPASSHQRRSCQTCALAKVKCIQSDTAGSSKCDRCRRLNKDCALQPVANRKPRARKRTTRVAQLEQKLDGIVSLLSTKDSIQPNPYHSPESLARQASLDSPAATSSSRLAEDGPAATDPRMGFAQDPAHCFRAVSPAAAQRYLELFQTKMAAYFPFVIIPREMSAELLRLEKPTLFSAMVLAASFEDIKQQTIFGESLLRHFIEELMIKGEKSLELLQALLIYICWYHFISHLKKRVTYLVSLASALVTDLGLARATPVNERLTITTNDTKGTYGCTSFHGERTLEERRAFTGIFYIASCISTCFRELPTMKLTAYLEDCCSALEHAAEYSTDVYLVKITRLQVIVERIAHAFQYGFRSTSPRQLWNVPITLYVAPFQREFDDFLSRLTPDLRQNNILMMHYYNARGYLYEIALYEPPQKTVHNHPSFRRMEMLYACLTSIQLFYDHLDKISPSVYYHIPMICWTQVTHTLVNLSKLCFLDADDWSVAHARELLDFSRLLEYVAGRFEMARAMKQPEAETNDWESDLFSRFARRMRLVKTKYDKRVAMESSAADVNDGSAGAALAPAPVPQGNDYDEIELFASLGDDDFWHGLAGNWNPIEEQSILFER